MKKDKDKYKVNQDKKERSSELEETLLGIPKPPMNSSPEDFEKTLLDIDLNNLDKKLQETLIFQSPFEEEKTKLHPEEVETRIFNLELEAEPEKLIPEETPPSLDSPLIPEEKSSLSSLENLKKNKNHLFFPQIYKGKNLLQVLPEFLGAILLLLLFDASIESILFSSPLSFFTISLTVIALFLNAYCLLKHKSFSIGLEMSLAFLFILFSVSVRKYGGNYPFVFSIFGQSLSALFNLIFLFSYLFIFGFIFCRVEIPKWVKIVLFLLFFYSCAGLIQNLGNGLFGYQVWDFEDTLLGSGFFEIIPLYYLRPILFSIWFLSFFSLLFLIIRKIFLMAKKNIGLLREDLSVFIVIIFSFILGHLILLNHHLPNFFALFRNYPLSTAQTTVLGSDHSAEVKIIGSSSNQNTRSYKLNASLVTVKDEKGSMFFSIRNQENHPILSLNKREVAILQKGEIQNPIQLNFLENRVIEPKNLYLMIDFSHSMSSLVPLLERSILPLFSFLNSKENFFLVPFSDSLKIVSIKNKEALKNELSRLFSYGSRNLSSALDTLLKKIKNENQPIIFLMTGSDSSLKEEELKHFSDRLKSLNIKLYLFVMGKEDVSPLKDLAEKSGGKTFSFSNEAELSLNLIRSFIEGMGEYLVEYKSKPLLPEIKITSPSSGSSIHENSFLILKIISSSGFKIHTARFYIDNNLNQEILIGAQSELYFVIPFTDLAAGSHHFKASVLTDGDKEFFSEEIILYSVKE